jgi:hypothetical protein
MNEQYAQIIMRNKIMLNLDRRPDEATVDFIWVGSQKQSLVSEQFYDSYLPSAGLKSVGDIIFLGELVLEVVGFEIDKSKNKSYVVERVLQ